MLPINVFGRDLLPFIFLEEIKVKIDVSYLFDEFDGQWC